MISHIRRDDSQKVFETSECNHFILLFRIFFYFLRSKIAHRRRQHLVNYFRLIRRAGARVTKIANLSHAHARAVNQSHRHALYIIG